MSYTTTRIRKIGNSSGRNSILRKNRQDEGALHLQATCPVRRLLLHAPSNFLHLYAPGSIRLIIKTRIIIKRKKKLSLHTVKPYCDGELRKSSNHIGHGLEVDDKIE